MKSFFKTGLTIGVILFIASSATFADTTGWNISKLDTARKVNYLSDLEKDIILEHNMVRSNPKKYAEMYIAPMLEWFKNETVYYNPITGEGIQTIEGKKAIKECIEVLSKKNLWVFLCR